MNDLTIFLIFLTIGATKTALLYWWIRRDLTRRAK